MSSHEVGGGRGECGDKSLHCGWGRGWATGSFESPCFLASVFSVTWEGRSVIYRERVEVGMRFVRGKDLEEGTGGWGQISLS